MVVLLHEDVLNRADLGHFLLVGTIAIMSEWCPDGFRNVLQQHSVLHQPAVLRLSKDVHLQ